MLKIFEDVFIMLKKVDDKTKLLKDKILWVKNFLLLTFVVFFL